MTVPMNGRSWGFVVWAALGVIAGGVAVGMAQEQKPGPVRTTRLEIVDDKGVPRISLGDVDLGQSAGAFGMELNDTEGRRLSVFGVKADGTQALSMKDPKGGAHRLQLVLSGGVVELLASDREARPRVRVRVMPEGAARITLLDKAGSVAEEMRVSAE